MPKGIALIREAVRHLREQADYPVAQPERWPNLVGPPLADWLESDALFAEHEGLPVERRHSYAVAEAVLPESLR